MSHYTTLAIVRKNSTRDVEDILAPYDENREVTPYIYQTKEELIKELTEEVENYRLCRKRALELSEEEYKEARTKEKLHYTYSAVIDNVPEGYLEVDLKDPEAVYALYVKNADEYQKFDREGNLLSTYNPKSRWDWYSLGGRWEGKLILKLSPKYNSYREMKSKSKRCDYRKRADQARAGDVDWDAMYTPAPEDVKTWGDFWDEFVLGKLPPEIAALDKKGQNTYLSDKYGFTLYGPEYYRDFYKTKEEYIRRQGVWTTYAVVDNKGWYEPGKMGWFGMSDTTAESEAEWDNNYRSRFIDTLDPDDEVYIIDCHI